MREPIADIERIPVHYTLPITIQVQIYLPDINDILETALEDGISYWCDHINVPGGLLGKSASQQLSLGGTLELVDEDGTGKELNKDNFLKGLSQYLTEAPGPIDGDIVNPGDIDSEAADMIIQYALFGELVYS